MKEKRIKNTEANKRTFERVLLVMLFLFMVAFVAVIIGVYLIFAIKGVTAATLVCSAILVGIFALLSTIIILSLIFKQLREKNLEKNKKDLLSILDKFTEKTQY